MVLKSHLRDTLTEVLEEHDIENADVVEGLVDRLQGILDVMDDDEESEEEDSQDVLGLHFDE